MPESRHRHRDVWSWEQSRRARASARTASSSQNQPSTGSQGREKMSPKRTLIFCRIKVRTVTRQKSLPLIKPHSFSIGNPAFSHASVPSAKYRTFVYPQATAFALPKIWSRQATQQPTTHCSWSPRRGPSETVQRARTGLIGVSAEGKIVGAKSYGKSRLIAITATQPRGSIT